MPSYMAKGKPADRHRTSSQKHERWLSPKTYHLLVASLKQGKIGHLLAVSERPAVEGQKTNRFEKA